MYTQAHPRITEREQQRPRRPIVWVKPERPVPALQPSAPTVRTRRRRLRRPPEVDFMFADAYPRPHINRRPRPRIRRSPVFLRLGRKGEAPCGPNGTGRLTGSLEPATTARPPIRSIHWKSQLERATAGKAGTGRRGNQSTTRPAPAGPDCHPGSPLDLSSSVT
jgi:hypothetical protein